ncbi:MAG TPA: SMC-Scp complex subunit ScpB [Cytophagales bacterium]|nr:SMC-Scp complex subunit ScpB [Cytophagales bacterium]HAP58666.1 SMC-Scp complex subunit ScpB [Cytophagales bacterium]
MDFLVNHVEALIFCSDKAVSADEIRDTMAEMFDAEVPVADVESAIETLMQKYQADIYSFQIEHVAGGYQFLTKPAYQASISILLKRQSKRRLSTSALETLSIIAYKQPITKGQIEAIRGVNCDYAVRKLLEKELIVIKGKSEDIGRPLLYGTTDKFMEYFGINSLRDLPNPKDFSHEANQIGQEMDGDTPAPQADIAPEEPENPTDTPPPTEE